MANTVRIGRTFNGFLVRDDVAVEAFVPNAIMDFQQTYSTVRDKKRETLIDQRFIAMGNYNFGVYAAASGMSLKSALLGAATLYLRQTSRFGGNPKNNSLIKSRFHDYLSENVGN